MERTENTARGELLASLPAFAGFYPRESLLVLGAVPTHDGTFTLASLARLDIDEIANKPGQTTSDLVHLFRGATAPAVFVVVASHRNEETADLPLVSEVDVLVTALRSAGFATIEAIHVPEFAKGARWSTYGDSDLHGTLPDPATTDFALALTYLGHQIHSDRDALIAQFDPAPQSQRAPLEPLVRSVVQAVRDETATNNLAALRSRLDELESALTTPNSTSAPLSDQQIANLIGAFASIVIADAVVSFAENEEADLPNMLLKLLRLAPQPQAAAIAGVLAAVSYLRGEGVWAGLAASAVKPPTNLSLGISQAMGLGMPHDFVSTALLRGAGEALQILRPPAS
ncbi:DUF4192 domain-containing protein [Amycolatopsis sp. NPDC047767]|uniref:DUF4192 domain-containing protein n=1 Tax=Amycolatopsis sp. NPDC047767 TaxID=3156765 RepID=UPI003453B97F